MKCGCRAVRLLNRPTVPYSKCRSRTHQVPRADPACRTRKAVRPQAKRKCSTSSTVGPTRANEVVRLSFICTRNRSHLRSSTLACSLHLRRLHQIAKKHCPLLELRNLPHCCCFCAAVGRCDAGEVSAVACPRSPHTALRIDKVYDHCRVFKRRYPNENLSEQPPYAKSNQQPKQNKKPKPTRTANLRKNQPTTYAKSNLTRVPTGGGTRQEHR
jgi:hypothetical protein